MTSKPRSLTLFLVATAFVCGAVVMVVEVLGSRVIGPFFGVSLFVWTSLITVTLVALAAGYALGGLFSDRRRSPDVLYALIFAAGLLVLLIPALKGPVLTAALPLGLRVGALASSFALFGPSLLLLGCVSPYVIKVAAREIDNIGRTVGLFYAVSTVGSFAGTLLTGFLLIPLFGVNRVFLAAGATLLALSVAYWTVFRGKWAAVAALVLPLLLKVDNLPAEIVRPDGVRIRILESSDGYYGNVKVVDYDYGPFYTRELAIDGLVQGGVDVRTGQSVYGYSYFLQHLPRALNPGGATCLVVGLGTGIVPRWYEAQGVRTDVVDIDPKVAEMARKYFGFSISGDVIIADARQFLRTSRKRYDYVVLDVFSGDTTPSHLLSLEALESTRERMAPGGVLAANIIGTLGERAFMTASIVRTFEEVFDVVECYPAFEPGEESFGNIAVMAYDGPPRHVDEASLRWIPVHPMAAARVAPYIGKKASFPPSLKPIVLTDDYNPVDFYDTWVKETLRRGILKGTEKELLL